MAAIRNCCASLFHCCRRETVLGDPVLGLQADDFALARNKVDYDNVLADSEREAVADLLNYLENVRSSRTQAEM